MTRFHVDAVLCDNDGTLVDSQPAVDRAWERWSARVGLDWSFVANRIHGRRASESIAELTPGRDLAAEDAWLERVELEELIDTTAIPGSAELLGALAGAPWAVATSASVRLAVARLDAAGLPVPEVVIGADLVDRGKPDPQPYLRAAEALDVDPVRCVVLEDSTTGVRAGAGAGCVVVGVRTADTHDTLVAAGATTTVADLRELRVTVAPDRTIELVVSR
ncbi:MAG: HAD-IA family hydrolase [Actinomycetota bacterium]